MIYFFGLDKHKLLDFCFLGFTSSLILKGIAQYITCTSRSNFLRNYLKSLSVSYLFMLIVCLFLAFIFNHSVMPWILEYLNKKKIKVHKNIAHNFHKDFSQDVMFEQQKNQANEKFAKLNTQISDLNKQYNELHKIIAKKLSIDDNLA